MALDEDASALETCIEDYGARGGDERHRVVSGMDGLPFALERKLRERGVRIILGTRVTRVVTQGTSGARARLPPARLVGGCGCTLCV
jgi:phytoene dehydrogenase-like protein